MNMSSLWLKSFRDDCLLPMSSKSIRVGYTMVKLKKMVTSFPQPSHTALNIFKVLFHNKSNQICPYGLFLLRQYMNDVVNVHSRIPI